MSNIMFDHYSVGSEVPIIDQWDDIVVDNSRWAIGRFATDRFG